MKPTILMLFISLLLYSKCIVAQPLKILTVDEAPANYKAPNGQAKGYVTDIVKAMQLYLGVSHIDIDFAPEARSLNILSNQPNVIFFSLSRTKHRESKYHWVGKVMEKSWWVYTLPTNATKLTHVDDLRKLSAIGVVRGDIREEWLVNKGFTNLQSVTHHKQNLNMLLKSRIPAIVYSPYGMTAMLEELNLSMNKVKMSFLLNRSPVYIVMSKGTSQYTVEQWQNAFAALKQNGTLKLISEKWQGRISEAFMLLPKIKDDILIL